ncbi:MAG TPA: glycerate kinase [Chitinophagaceae bacterium]|nr:glycerate kinase [Chitinophagaceae bacterium]
MHILIAPNAFKNSLSAADAAKAIKQGLQKSKLHCTCECFPIADGGDGTAQLIIKKCEGKIITEVVQDPLGRKIKASFGLIDKGKTAVIEMADASGLRLLKHDELNPLQASSTGTGELIKLALDKNVTKIIIAMGGSATVDGGTGILSALGVKFLNAKNKLLTGLPENLIHLDTIDVDSIDYRILSCKVIVLCDVDNKLLGDNGAAAVFGPQKGATPKGVKKLEASLTKLTEVAFKQTGKDMAAIKYGGAAGGAAGGLSTFLNAKLVNGIEYFLQLTTFEEALKQSDIVITGEGSIDEQTLQGKGPFGVAVKAKKRGIPVIAISGKIPLEPRDKLKKYFDVLLPIGNEPTGIKTALLSAKNNLMRTSTEIGNLLALIMK